MRSSSSMIAVASSSEPSRTRSARAGAWARAWSSTPVHSAIEPRSPPVQLRRIETISSSCSARSVEPGTSGSGSGTRSRSSAVVGSSGASCSAARRGASTERMIASKRSATSRVRSSSPEREASWLSDIHCSSSGSSTAGQPSHVVCPRTANTAPSAATASTSVPAAPTPSSSSSTRPPATSRSTGARRAISSGPKNGSVAARIAACSAPSRPFGTWRKRETPEEKLSASSTTASASAWPSTTQVPSGVRASGERSRSSSVAERGSSPVGSRIGRLMASS